MFVLVPLLFVGLALWIESGLPRPRSWAWATLAVACVLPVIVPIARFEYTAEFQSLALLRGRASPRAAWPSPPALPSSPPPAASSGRPSGARTAGRAWMLAAAAMVVVGAIASLAHAERATNSATPVSVGRATWVDDAVPAGARVAVLWDERRARGESLDPFYPWLMVTELFNAGLGDVYRLGPPTYYEDWLLPDRPGRAAAGRRVSRAQAGGGSPTADYVLTTCRTSADGTVVARSLSGSLVLSRVDGPLRLAAGPTCRKNVPWEP